MKTFTKVLALLLLVSMLLSMLAGCIQYDRYLVEIVVKDYGSIKVELITKYAPKTVANFVSLVEKEFYDGLTFHRIIDNFMIQGGCPNGDGTGDAGYEIKGEFAANGFMGNHIKHDRGVISMARGGHSMDSASCQFFITNYDSPHLDGQYAAFGYVVSGMDVVDKITKDKAPLGDDNGAIKDKTLQPVIESIRVIDRYNVD